IIAGCSDYAGAAKSSKFRLPERFAGIDTVIDKDMNEVVMKYNPVNLNAGAPNFLPPTFVRSTMWNVSVSDDPAVNQYSNPDGHKKLQTAVARLYSDLINRDLDPNENVIITVGASEALYVTIQAHTNPGDEWILIEPAFTAYRSLVKMAGGVPKLVQLRPKKTRGKISSSDWMYDRKEMARAFNRKTKGILINTPHNPTGKVFTKEELQFIADLAVKWNTLVVTDEVYEWMIYKPNKHVRIAGLPDMYERTITISSASKTFSVTGWRVGWLYGPSELLSNVRAVHFKLVYSDPTPSQIAVAAAMNNFRKDLDRPNSYLSSYLKELQSKRNDVVDMLEEIGMSPIVPEGGFFVMANWTALSWRARLQDERGAFLDVRFAKWLAKNVGVLGAPVSPFYNDVNDKNSGESYLRFCFIKKNKTLQEAAKLLLEWIQWQ
ncbi:hypothetical protein TSAR_011543, partial [Trichomalopsis sarcophagae]